MSVIINEIAQILNELQISESENQIIKTIAEVVVDLNLTNTR